MAYHKNRDPYQKGSEKQRKFNLSKRKQFKRSGKSDRRSNDRRMPKWGD